jgi:class 3 adenylate cyclase
VLFTDIVDSTRRAAEMGDRDWRALLDAHDAIVRSQLARFRGREVNTSGAGLATVVVSSMLRDLLIGSGLRFEERGAHQLKGVRGEWRLFAVASA